MFHKLYGPKRKRMAMELLNLLMTLSKLFATTISGHHPQIEIRSRSGHRRFIRHRRRVRLRQRLGLGIARPFVHTCNTCMFRILRLIVRSGHVVRSRSIDIPKTFGAMGNRVARACRVSAAVNKCPRARARIRVQPNAYYDELLRNVKKL